MLLASSINHDNNKNEKRGRPLSPYLKVWIRHWKENNCFSFHKDKEAFCNSSIIILWYINMPLRSGFSIRAGSWWNSPAISCELAAYHVSLEITSFFYMI